MNQTTKANCWMFAVMTLIVLFLICIGWVVHSVCEAIIKTSPATGKQAVLATEGRSACIEPTFEDLMDAIEQVESGGDPWAVGDNGEAVGSFQIHKIYVDDVKRILLKSPLMFSWSAGIPDYKDRYDPELSREIVEVYLKHYGGTFEEMARKHNGGPAGHKKECTKKYWEKVKILLEKQND